MDLTVLTLFSRGGIGLGKSKEHNVTLGQIRAQIIPVARVPDTWRGTSMMPKRRSSWRASKHRCGACRLTALPTCPRWWPT